MGPLEILALFAVMTVLALVPSTSVALVVSRSATTGFTNGAAVAAGIVLGDLILICFAILGATALSEMLGSLFLVLKYVAGAYLIWFGLTLLRPRTATPVEVASPSVSTLPTSFLSGLAITLGDVKALFFYASLLPAFVDPDNLRATDIAILLVLTVVTVGGIKLGYAYAARQLISATRGFKPERAVSLAAGGLMMAMGVHLMTQ
ncbi:LysE family translocator [Porticoccus sp.]